MILPDTSAWVAYLRSGSEEITHELSTALDQREVLACGSLTDLEIAVAAHVSSAALWTSDQHFKRIEPTA